MSPAYCKVTNRLAAIESKVDELKAAVDNMSWSSWRDTEPETEDPSDSGPQPDEGQVVRGTWEGWSDHDAEAASSGVWRAGGH